MTLGIAMVLSMTTWFSTAAVLPHLRAHWEIGESEASVLGIAVQVGFVVGALVIAGLGLADVIGTRVMIAAGAWGAATFNALLLAVDSAGLALTLRFATGAFLAAVYPSALKQMATWFTRERGMALGVMVGALTLGSATPHFLDALGGADWRLVIATTSALTALGGGIALLITTSGPFAAPSPPFDLRVTRAALANHRLRLVTLGYLGHMWELYAMWTWIGVFLADAFASSGFAKDSPAAAFATFGVVAAGALGCWGGGLLGDRWGRARTTVLALTLSGGCALGLAVAVSNNAPLTLVCGIAALWGVTVIADSAQLSTLATEVADPQHIGTALAAQLAAGFSLTVATIWLVPALEAAYSWSAAFVMLSLGPLVGLLAMRPLLVRDRADGQRIEKAAV